MAFLLNNQVIREYIEHCGKAVDARGHRLVGIRGAVPMSNGLVSLRGNTLDHWNDTIGVWGERFELFSGTVDPGRYWTEQPGNPVGAAHLVGIDEPQGEPCDFQWGTHRGLYECLIQAEEFFVRRDKNRNGVIEAVEPGNRGNFGIHIHWGGSGWSVGQWSAGCQVINGGNGLHSPWTRFKGILKASGQTKFTYYLLDGVELAKHMGVL